MSAPAPASEIALQAARPLGQPPARASARPLAKPARLDFVDWARGLACVLMFEAHVFDAWVRPSERAGIGWALSRFLSSIPSSLFIFLAGVGIALKADSALRKAGPEPGAAAEARRRTRAAVARRGLDILGFALLFRVFYFLVDRDTRLGHLLRVDILNVIAVAVVLGALCLPRRAGDANLPALAAGCAMALFTPIVTRLFRLLPAWVPTALTDYVAERAPWRDFPALPMAAFVFFGLFAGGLIARAQRDPSGRATARLAALFVVAGAALAFVFHAASHELYHLFWAARRLGRADWAVVAQVLYFSSLEAALLGACYYVHRALSKYSAPQIQDPIGGAALGAQRAPRREWGPDGSAGGAGGGAPPVATIRDRGEKERPGTELAGACTKGRFAPMIVLGQTSLLVYFLHIELAYGVVANPLKGALALGETAAGLLLVTAAMVAVGTFRLRADGWLRRHRPVLVVSGASALLAYTAFFRGILALHPFSP